MPQRDATLPITDSCHDRGGDGLSTFLIRIGQSNRPRRPLARILDLRGVEVVHLGRGDEDAVVGAEGTLRWSLRDRWMSGQHASIRCFNAGQAPLCVLEDRGSTNGCRVNGAAVRHHELRNGDIVETGQTFFRFHQDQAQDADELLALAYQGGTVEPTSSVAPALLRGLLQASRVAATEIPLILLGPSGAGKEVLSAALHHMSGRPGQFVALNCAAIPVTLMESELFGHRKGAFTGAQESKRGVVEEADGGTLFLDEIGDMPLAVQAALLRLIQERSFTRVGETRIRSVDVRFIAATNRNLERMVTQETFRGDLFARLNGLCLRLPALHDRVEDLGLLLSEFLARCGSNHELSLDAYRALLLYRWPYNIRELLKTITTAAALAGEGPWIRLSHLPRPVQEAADGPQQPATATEASPEPSPPGAADEPGDLRQRMVVLLTEHRGNLASVARAMSTSRAQVHRLLKRAGLTPGDFRRGREAQ